jgi:predicted DNA-binding transcriptional regulator YafY
VPHLPDVLGPKVVRLAVDTLTPAHSDGWQPTTIPLESLQHAAASLLRLGADVQVLAPPALCAHMTDTIQAMARLYAVAGSRSDGCHQLT